MAELEWWRRTFRTRLYDPGCDYVPDPGKPLSGRQFVIKEITPTTSSTRVPGIGFVTHHAESERLATDVVAATKMILALCLLRAEGEPTATVEAFAAAVAAARDAVVAYDRRTPDAVPEKKEG